jgi:pimeloyl-[acyl-carrier protein] methyl ester esterase
MGSGVYWQVEGHGRDVVLVHGWGMNGAVWESTVERLKPHHCVHVVDLPGYGHSASCHAATLEEIAQQLVVGAPKNAIWVGWSLGGLVATHMAMYHPAYVSKLVTVASSPKFAAEPRWRGIQPPVLSAFTAQLLTDFQLTIERFMALQAMGSPTARQDVKWLKQAVLSRPAPDPNALLAGLAMLAEIDLRSELTRLSLPFLRLYGRLDGLVPVKVADELALMAPTSDSHIFTHSSHAPFITEAQAFCERVLQFCASE